MTLLGVWIKSCGHVKLSMVGVIDSRGELDCALDGMAAKNEKKLIAAGGANGRSLL